MSETLQKLSFPVLMSDTMRLRTQRPYFMRLSRMLLLARCQAVAGIEPLLSSRKYGAKFVNAPHLRMGQWSHAMSMQAFRAVPLWRPTECKAAEVTRGACHTAIRLCRPHHPQRCMHPCHLQSRQKTPLRTCSSNTQSACQQAGEPQATQSIRVVAILVAWINCLNSCSRACAKDHDALAMGDVFSCQALVTAAQAKPQIKGTARLTVTTISSGSL